MEIKTLPLDNLGLVAGVFDQLDIADLIDDWIPKLRNHNLDHSKIIKAMTLNGLGYVGQRLYLFPEFTRSFLLRGCSVMVSQHQI